MTEAVPRPVADPRTGAGGLVPPSRVDGVTLIGEMKGSGYRVAPALARRPDGQTVQLTPLLYATLSALDGRRSYAEVAAVVAGTTGKPVNEDNARLLVDKLRPLGLAAHEDGSQPEVRRSNPLLALRFKVAVTDERTTNRLTAPFAWLFSGFVVVPVLLAFGWISWWVLFDRGLAAATHDAFAKPGLLLAVLAVTVLSGGFHEFGHAAAARRGGANPGVMGAGIYLVWPAFYTDVTDSYRLGRAGRLRTDLGGLYFNAIVAVATAAVWWMAQDDALLLLVAAQILQMLRQLLPFVRFDGYHVLADLTGVPDLFQRIGPTLRSLVPWRAPHPEARALKPWARGVVTLWVLTVVPVLLLTAVSMVLALPRVAGTAWASAGAQQDAMVLAYGDGDPVAALARGFAMVIVLMPIVASVYMVARLVRQIGGRVLSRTRGKPVERTLAAVTAAAVVAGLTWAWWPSEDRYRPVQAYEGGTVTDVIGLASAGTGITSGVDVGTTGAGTVMWPDGTALPTRESPQLAAVLIPKDQTTETDTGTGTATAAPGGPGGVPSTEGADSGADAPAGSQPWIFPLDEPLAPGEGDTQAVAANTTDGTATYDVAFALVWADGDQPVDNTNEAYALASCDNCAAVAVAFQVVLVVGQADVAVPQNISVALNYDCTSCLTYSLAVQLFVTLDGPLSDEAMARLDDLWSQVMAYGANIGQVPLDSIQAQLTEFEGQILALIQEDQGTLTDGGASSSPTPSDSASPTEPTESVDPTESPTDSPTESPGGSTGVPSESPTVSETTEPTESPSTTTSTSTSSPTTSPSPTTEPSPTEPTATTSPSASP